MKVRRRFKMAPPEPYRSWYEVNTAIDLLRRGVDFDYESVHLLYIEPQQVRKYKPDFRLGKERALVVETKGRWTPADRKKMSLVIEQNPELDIRMLFQRDNTISKKSKVTYTAWCEKRDIKCAVGEVPAEWLKEL